MTKYQGAYAWGHPRGLVLLQRRGRRILGLDGRGHDARTLAKNALPTSLALMSAESELGRIGHRVPKTPPSD